MKIPIAVVVLNWNGKALSRACLASWKKAEPAPARILLVDNGSADGSVAALRRSFKGIEILALAGNLGFAAGNNRGFEQLWRKGPKVEAVFICNNDTEVQPDMLGRLWQALKSRPQWGAVGPRILFHGSQRVWFEGAEIRPWTGSPRHLGYGHAATQPKEPFQLGAAGFVTGCGLLIRAQALKALKGFDESLWSYAEDSDLCQRLRQRGLACGIVPAASMSHKVSASFGLGSPLAQYYATRNSWALLQRHRLGAWPLNLVGFAAVSKARAFRALLMGQGAVAMAILQGLLHGFLGRRGLRPVGS